jgi:NAD(P)-dependent dehydrogenase (short-subunit alcohol dehydrogenase family)/3-oxoacyl-(acyl-carrier-protein) synthase
VNDLAGRLALVTGGGRGVGKAIALSLARRGAHVLINCFHSYDQAKRTQAELTALGARADVIRSSIAKEDQVTRMFAEIEKRYGYLDILVNNAAAGWFGPVKEIGSQHFARALDANLLGSFWCARHAAPLMSRRGGGTIVNVSSVGAGMVPDNYLVVGTSKAAVEALTRHLAVEYAPLGVRVNTASCSLIQGETAQLFPRADEMQRVTVEATPLGRLASAEDLTGVVAFLTSDLSRFVTGQVILADGGLGLGIARLPALAPAAAVGVSPVASAAHSASSACNPACGPGLPPVANERGPLRSQEPTADDQDPIAVVGMGLALPGASSPQDYWQLLTDGADLFVDPPADRWDKQLFYSSDRSAADKTYQAKGGFITNFRPDPELDAELAADAVLEEYTTRWLRHALRQALRGVGRRDGDRFSFVVGYTPDGSQHLEESLVLTCAMRRLKDLAKHHPRRDQLISVADRLLRSGYARGAPGSAMFMPHEVGRAAMAGVLPDDTELVMVDTACSSSLYAVDIGIKSLLLGTADIAACGGSFALGPRNTVLFSKLQGLSTVGVVRSLDRDADGVLFSDGAGVVVLKRLSRARADGDRILGLLAGIGSSSDGKGKAIHAPNADGQALAVRRALAAPGVDSKQIDWVAAHATGTSAGDRAELAGLRASPHGSRSVHVTSNKSLIGHTGWAAGVASLIEVLLAIEHDSIPRQHRFVRAPDVFELGSRLRISGDPVAWPRRDGGPRAACVSGFGFGGTNAHLVVQEYDGSSLPTPAVRADEPVAIVGWSAHFPELDGRVSVESWVRGYGRSPAASFGDAYPRPSFEKVRIPPKALPTIDRSQLMILEAVAGLAEDVAELWRRGGDRTAVLVGHMGPTRNATLYAQRCHLGAIRAILSAGDPVTWEGGLGEIFERYAEDVRGLVPESNEDSFSGSMPNVIPARVANYLDLHGPNMTVDTGLASTLSALAIAVRYLRAGEVDLALVAGINGNSTPEAQATLAGELGPNTPCVAEGAVTFAVVRESTARENGLPILALVDFCVPPAAGSSDADSGHGSDAVDVRWAGYLGAAGALAVLRAILGAEAATTVISSPTPKVPIALRLRHPTAASQLAAAPVPTSPPQAAPTDAQLLDPMSYAPGQRTRVRRYVVELEAALPEAVRPPLDLISPGTAVLTDNPLLLAGIVPCPGSLLLSTRAADPTPGAEAALPAITVLPEVTEQAVDDALRTLGSAIRHVRLVTDLTAATDPRWDEGADPGSILVLHDLLFLTVRAAYAGLRGSGSLVICLLGGLPGGHVHPFAGMFAGFVKSAAMEMPDCRAFALVTATRDPTAGLSQAIEESTARQQLPVTVLDGQRRLVLALRRQDAPLAADAAPRISPDSVVLAVGGSRGITAEVLKEIAARHRPVIWVLGSNDLSDEIELPPKAEFLRAQRRRDPGRSVAEINRGYERLCDAREARKTIAELERLSGAGRVAYLQADVRDAAAIEDAVGRVLRESGRIDVLLNAAGVIRSSSITNKAFDEFRAVRDIKVRGYQNLKRAIGARTPALWCNFGSIIGLTGQAGETDYAAANDFLATASRYSSLAVGRAELTIGWNLWSAVGLGSTPVKRSFLEKSGTYSRMETEEGVHHFLREMSLPRHDPSIIFMGEAEEAALREYKPDFFSGGGHPSSAAQDGGSDAIGPRGRFFVDRVLAATRNEVEFERTFDLMRDPYLADHLVRGQATLPGTFATEIAAEAASLLDQGRVPVGFDDVVLASFLRVYPAHRPVRKKVQARVVRRDEEETVVGVRILTDVVAPNGAVLARDREHFAMTVRLRDELPRAPRWEPWPAADDGPSVGDPYHIPNPAVLLSGAFVSTRETRVHALGRRAEYDLRIEAVDRRFGQLLVPVILLDGLLRVSVLDVVEGGYLMLAAPVAIRRINLYEARNDVELASAYPRLALYSCPPRVDLEDERRPNRCVAVAPDGHVVGEIHDTTAAAIGYVHQQTGAFRTPEQIAQLLDHRDDGWARTSTFTPTTRHEFTDRFERTA